MTGYVRIAGIECKKMSKLYPTKSWQLCLLIIIPVIGGLMNLLVKLSNGGMPTPSDPAFIVTRDGSLAIQITSATHFAFLADRFKFGVFYFSAGDILMFLFFPLFVLFTLWWLHILLLKIKELNKGG